MPVQLEWLADHPVIMLTYSGVLTAQEYRAMLGKRATMLGKGGDSLIVVADVTRFEAFTAPEQARGPGVLAHPRVKRLVLVLPPRLYQMVARTTAQPANPDHRVLFCRSVEQALGLIQSLRARPE